MRGIEWKGVMYIHMMCCHVAAVRSVLKRCFNLSEVETCPILWNWDARIGNLAQLIL